MENKDKFKIEMNSNTNQSTNNVKTTDVKKLC